MHIQLRICTETQENTYSDLWSSLSGFLLSGTFSLKITATLVAQNSNLYFFYSRRLLFCVWLYFLNWKVIPAESQDECRPHFIYYFLSFNYHSPEYSVFQFVQFHSYLQQNCDSDGHYDSQNWKSHIGLIFTYFFWILYLGWFAFL